jgi:hypothetical protein
LTQRVFVLGARSYSFNDEKTGNLVEGASVKFVDGNKSQARGATGLDVMEAALSKEALPALQQAPGVYDLECALRPAQKGVSIRVLGARLVKSIDLAGFLKPNGAAA